MEKMKLGLQLYTLRDYMCTPELFKKSMAKVAEMGYKYVQISGVADGLTNEEIIEHTIEKYGLGIGLTHWEDKEILEETEKVVEIHDRFGCDCIGIGGMPRPMRTYEGYSRFIETYGPAVEKIHKMGKKFCYHNHWFEFERYQNGKTGMEMLIEGMPEGFGLNLDTAWAHRAGIDCAQLIRRYPDKIHCLHLKDLTIVNDELSLTEVCNGNMNFDTIIEESVKAGVEWAFVEQDFITSMNAYDSVKCSYDNLMNKYPEYLK